MTRFFETAIQDLRYGARNLVRGGAGFTFTAVAALTLGIGFNTAIFSVLNTVLLKSLPYRDPESLVMVWENNRPRHHPKNVIAPADFLDWKARNHVFENLSAIADLSVTLTGVGEPEQVEGQGVSSGFLPMLGVRPIVGRGFSAQEEKLGGDRVVLLSYQLWRRKFGGAASVLGRVITLDARPYTVIGVLPADFKSIGDPPDILTAMAFDPARDYRVRAGRYMRAVGRLKPGIPLQRAQAEMDRIAASLEVEYPRFNTGWGVNLVRLDEQFSGGSRPVLLVLMGAVAFVLLIACANVANLLLARAAQRARELAVRTALGASPGRILRQLVTESMLLALAGCVLGSLLAYWSVASLRALAPRDVPRVDELAIDWRVLAFTAGISLLAGLLFGLAPAIHAMRATLADAMKAGRGNTAIVGQRRSGNLFIAVETALAFILLAGAGLMIRSLTQLQAVHPGFDPDRVLTMMVDLPSASSKTPEKTIAFFHDAVERISHLPGVASASAISGLPFAGLASATDFRVAGRPMPEPGKAPVCDVRVIEPSYFQTMRIPLVRGRAFDERDERPGAPRTFVISQDLARTIFPNEDPIGQSLIVEMGDDVPGQVVGIVGDVLHTSLEDTPRPMVYYTRRQLKFAYGSLVVRTAGDPLALARPVTSIIRSMDPNQPVTDIKTMRELLSTSTARKRYTMFLLAIFAGVALLLAAAGIYGVTSYTVLRRRQEIGIRMALGAQRSDVWRMVIAQGIRPVAVGLLAGSAGALVLTKFLSGMLYGVGARDPLTFAGVAAFLAMVAVFACLVPARTATAVDPATTLSE